MSQRERWLLLALAILLLWVLMKKFVVDQDVVNKFARAIANAEGFFLKGSRPQRNHNPGDLTRDTTGKSVGMDEGYVRYANDVDGWEALYKQVRLMFTGASSYYNRTMTILEVAKLYTSTEQPEWAGNVAKYLGVTIDTKLEDIRGG